ncbi:MAG: alcohol dehydrogenase catalytic domain-containing protein [Candidatus Sumerlaeia bacterium]|nr:alcohol dehydrogenase catalytic domain-containing protein [Candidatus Sumerlaeia bacterium]
MTQAALPEFQHAVQLVGPGELKLNNSKPIHKPGPHQMLAKVEAVGLCFSDLKLLGQFSEHARKGPVITGLANEILDSIPSYAPGDKPTVPGHEVVLRIIEIGDKVKDHKVGERVLVQADWRNLKTAKSNGAFGYNFEGALQEYVLLDERVVIDPEGERYLLPVAEHLGASQAALVEPWACVEDSYVTRERQTILPGGRLLVVADEGHVVEGIEGGFSKDGKSASVSVIYKNSDQLEAANKLGIQVSEVASITDLADESFDDIIYFGADKKTLEVLNDKLAPYAIMNVVKGGKNIGELVSVGVGRVHYAMTRWVGTPGNNAADGYKCIPATGELRDGDSILVIGAGGPMGQMHVIRNICSGRKEITLVGTDFDDPRLKSIGDKARPFADANKVAVRMVNPSKNPLEETFSYFAIMAPVGAVVAQSILDSKPGAIINIFAGIPIPVKHDLELDVYIDRGLFMFGTSGSTIEDMKILLGKVTSGQLNTNSSVDAISGMAGAIDGIRAVENRTMAGKIIVYPMLPDVPLIPLEDLGKHFPSVAAKLENGQWCREAEEELIRVGTVAKAG